MNLVLGQFDKYAFPMYADPSREFYSKFAEKYIPCNYLIDRDGNIVYKSVGFTEEQFETLKAEINKQITL